MVNSLSDLRRIPLTEPPVDIPAAAPNTCLICAASAPADVLDFHGIRLADLGACFADGLGSARAALRDRRLQRCWMGPVLQCTRTYVRAPPSPSSRIPQLRVSPATSSPRIASPPRSIWMRGAPAGVSPSSSPPVAGQQTLAGRYPRRPFGSGT